MVGKLAQPIVLRAGYRHVKHYVHVGVRFDRFGLRPVDVGEVLWPEVVVGVVPGAAHFTHGDGWGRSGARRPSGS